MTYYNDLNPQQRHSPEHTVLYIAFLLMWTAVLIWLMFEYVMQRLCFYAPPPRWFITVNSLHLLQLAVQMQMQKNPQKQHL